MSWQPRDITWSRRSRRELGRLPPQVADRIIRAVERYRLTGHGDVTKLAGVAAEYRLRVGDWRVRFDYDEATNHVTVLHVLPRGRAYRD